MNSDSYHDLREYTENAAKKMFPDEVWEEKVCGVFVAQSRKPKNKDQKRIFDKEFKAANIAAKNGHIVYLLPEKGGGKHPDAIMDGIPTEFKILTGGRNAISDNLRKGLKQGKSIFIKTNTIITVQEAKSIIHGRLKGKKHLKGKIYYYNEQEKIFYEWKMQDFI